MGISTKTFDVCMIGYGIMGLGILNVLSEARQEIIKSAVFCRPIDLTDATNYC